MDSKTKFLIATVILAAVFGIGMSYYRYIVLKDIDLYYLEDEDSDTDEEIDLMDESKMETEEVTEGSSEGVGDNVEIETMVESQTVLGDVKLLQEE